jgi:hypothetical protein
MGIYASDCETTGLLDQMADQENPRLHNFCSIEVETGEVVLFEWTQKEAIQDWFNQGHTFITHNCKTYDNPALQFLGYDTSKIKWVDSLLLSWYLEPTRMVHGLAQYGEEFGVPKPKIENWENQTQEEYNHRVIEDCKIQRTLWKRQVSRLQELYGKTEGSYDRLISYLMWKGDCLRIQQDKKVKLDISAAEKLQGELSVKIEDKTLALIEVMPKVPIYSIKKNPAKKFLKNGELSSTGLKWKELTDSLGLPFDHQEDIKVVTEWKSGNPASHVQMKSWLESLFWVPETFKFIREENGETRQIPQINLRGGEICQSVKDLIPKCTGIEHIAGLGILNHRHSVVKGFIREAFRGELVASSQGFTNTIRMQHRLPLCNLPSTRVPYGEEIRSLLIAREGETLMGSDLSGVESFVKNHYQFKLDPKYVETQLADGYDPHLDIAITAGMMTLEESNWYKWYKKNKGEHNSVDDIEFARLDIIRSLGKTTNYGCQYGAGVKTIARTAKISEKLARKLHEGYNKLNWSLPKIASMMVVKKTSFGDWQINPVNKFWYSLRSDKDRCSTLIQGTSAYVFDIWLYQCYLISKKRGIDYNLLCQMHDDQLLAVPIGKEVEYEAMIRDALAKVNDILKLNVAIRCDIMFGDNGASVH